MTPADVLVSTLPWIDRYTPRGPFDFVNTYDGSRVEVKDCSSPTAVNYRSPDRDYTVQVSFTHIYPERFDWLICGHKDERRFWHILLFSQEQVARGFFLFFYCLTYNIDFECDH